MAISEYRTWRPGPEGYRAANTVTVKQNFDGTLAARMPLDPEQTLASIGSVTVSGDFSPTISTTAVSSDGLAVEFDSTALSTTGTVTVIVTATDQAGTVIPFECTLVVA